MKNEKKEKKKNNRFSSFDAVLKITTSPKLLTFFYQSGIKLFNHSIAVFFSSFYDFLLILFLLHISSKTEYYYSRCSVIFLYTLHTMNISRDKV